MPLLSCFARLNWLKTEGRLKGNALKIPVLVSAAVLAMAGLANAGEIEAPQITLCPVNWAAAAATLSDHGIDTPAEEFARINRLTERRFPGIAKSSVPVLLPIDIDAFRAAEDAAIKSDALFRPVSTLEFFPGRTGRILSDLLAASR